MPRILTASRRTEISLNPDEKAILMRAASLKRLDLTNYIRSNIIPKAKADILESEKIILSERDSLHVLALLENPPAAPDRLIKAAKAGFKLS